MAEDIEIPITKPKAFLWAADSFDENGKVVCDTYATAEDGTMLGRIKTPGRIYARRLIEYYVPDEYEIVDLLGLTAEELDAHEGLTAAIDKGLEP